MSTPISPFESHPPSAKKLLGTIAAAIAGAALALVAFVLPAEYNIDPTGIGRALGLDAMRAPARTLQIKDVTGGNERYREVAIPDPGDPVPLPNPAVVQVKPAVAQSKVVTVNLEPGQQTEIKAVMDSAQVVLYAWTAEGGEVYTDFHGHEPGAGEAFVRYEEQQSARQGQGSLVAPFAGEHGWFWLNIAEQPVTITLEVRGYYSDIVDYGLF